MSAGDELNRNQYSIFGGLAGGDQDAAAVGKLLRQDREEMADRIIAKTGQGPYGHPDTYRETLAHRNMPRSALMSLANRPPSEVRDSSWLLSGGLGAYDKSDQSIEVRTPSTSPYERRDDIHTMAHELGHHIHLGNAFPDTTNRLNNHWTDADPVHEGAADGFADRISGTGRYLDRSGYPEMFANAPSNIDEAVQAEEGNLHGPTRAFQMYALAREMARGGEWPSPDMYHYRNVDKPVHTQGTLFGEDD